MALELILTGPPITKKNSQRIITVHGRPRVIPSAQYTRYERDCIAQLARYRTRAIDTPVNIACVYYMPTRRKVDLTNLNESIHDILVRAGILADDNRDIIASTDGSRVYYDKLLPRVEITIMPAERGYQQWAKKSK